MGSLWQSEGVRVGVILVVALMAIVYMNPPHTPCQSQVEVYDGAMGPLNKPFNKAIGLCKEHTDPGGCVSFFEMLDRIEQKYKEVAHSCQQDLAKDTITRAWVTNSMDLMVRAAWGSKPPTSSVYKNGWLEISQIVEFCRLRHRLEELYGKTTWEEFANYLMVDLPGAPDLTKTAGRNEIWNRSILSDPCNYAL